MISTAGWRESKWLPVVELALVALIFIADWQHLIYFSKTPFLFALGWASLWLRRVGWRGLGLARYRSWGTTLALGLAAGVVLDAQELFLTQPLLVWLTGKQPGRVLPAHRQEPHHSHHRPRGWGHD